MIKGEHIVHLKLDRVRLLAHRNMPPPPHSTKALTSQIAAIGESVISSLLGVSTDVFQMQLEAAREFKVSYLIEDGQKRMCGVSAATSLIKDGDILGKNLVIPRDMLWKDPRLRDHYIVSVFVRGNVVDGIIPELDEVEVAGWINNYGIRTYKREELPPTFKSKLPVVMIPCAALNPIESLADQFRPELAGF